jgi:4-hydroxy-2-oxoheptanedioate aldolase
MAGKQPDHGTNSHPTGDAHTERFGAWAIMGHRVGVEAMCRLGFDFVGVDAQHGFFAFDEASVAIQVANLCGVPCFVRVPAGQVDWIPRYLDAGADGIVVAMVENVRQVERAVQLSRHQPVGMRSYGGGKRNGVGETGAVEFATAPEVLPMIETREAFESVEKIAEVPGIAGLFVGPVDLSLALERPYPFQSDDEPWRKALRTVVASCARHSVRPGMFATDGDDASDWLAFGFRDIVVSSDIAMLRRSLHEHLTLARAARPERREPRDRVAAPYTGR